MWVRDLLSSDCTHTQTPPLPAVAEVAATAPVVAVTPVAIEVTKPTEEIVRTEVVEAVKNALSRLLPTRSRSVTQGPIEPVCDDGPQQHQGPDQQDPAAIASEAVMEVCCVEPKFLAEIPLFFLF